MGEISTAIGDLTSLLSIDLRGNLISGQIPNKIGDYVALKYLDFSFNELYGDIPFWISKLKQLENLVLKNNKLIGPIPSSLSEIPNLKVLDLAQNKLSGEIPRLIYWNRSEWQQFGWIPLSGHMPTHKPVYFDVGNKSLTSTIPFDLNSAFQVFELE